MRIGNRLFPYPTINNSKNATCFKNCDYALEYEDEESKEFFILKNARIVLDNEELLTLMAENKVEAAVIVECSSTIFRKRYPISTEPSDIRVPISLLRGKVEVSCYIYAKEAFSYSNKSFLDAYEGYTFDIEKYDILAIDDGFTAKIEYDDSEDKKVSSIFHVTKSDDIELKTAMVHMEDKFIVVVLPEKEFGFYDNLKANEYYQNIFFSILAIPALVKCLQELQNDDPDIDAIRLDYSWFESIMAAYEKNYGCELTNDIFAEIDVYELSQTLLNSAILGAIGDISLMYYNQLMNGGDDDDN